MTGPEGSVGAAGWLSFEGAEGVAGSRGVSMAAAALRWLRHHSMLDGQAGDAIIIGASSLDQLRSNLTALDAGPLPAELVRAFDEAWDLARPEAPVYWRA